MMKYFLYNIYVQKLHQNHNQQLIDKFPIFMHWFKKLGVYYWRVVAEFINIHNRNLVYFFYFFDVFVGIKADVPRAKHH